MKISVITVSFNQINWLPDAIESVAKQDYPDYEHIVIDPGSSDGSREYLQEIALANPRIKLVFESDQGPADGLNKGLSLATGDIFVYINSDDAFAPGAFRTLASEFECKPVDIVIGNGWSVGSDSKVIEFLRSDKFSPLAYAIGLGIVVQQATAFRLSFLRKLDIKFNPENKVSWDIEIVMDCWNAGAKFHYLDAPLGYFRKYAGTITGDPKYATRLRTQKRLLQGKHPIGRFRLLSKAIEYPARVVKRLSKVVYLKIRKPRFEYPWGSGSAETSS